MDIPKINIIYNKEVMNKDDIHLKISEVIKRKVKINKKILNIE